MEEILSLPGDWMSPVPPPLQASVLKGRKRHRSVRGPAIKTQGENILPEAATVSSGDGNRVNIVVDGLIFQVD